MAESDTEKIITLSNQAISIDLCRIHIIFEMVKNFFEIFENRLEVRPN